MIPAALCYTFGVMVGDTRQGWTVLAAMTVIFVGLLATCYVAEQRGAVFAKQGVDHTASALQSGGNMEGKEVRYGIASSALWATATTVASNGSVNSMHDSYTPIGGLVPMWSIQLGEVVFGGVGSGLYGMLMFAIVAVFVSGLMVGRTPEYLGKKIEAYEMKMSSLVILITPALVLIGAAVGVVAAAGKAGMANPGAHGFSEVLYAFSSASNNNGSAFAGLSRQYAVLQHRPRPGHAVRPLLAGRPGAGHRRLAREEEDRAERSRDAPHAHAAVRRAPDRRRDPRRSPDICPGARPGADRRTPHVGRGEVKENSMAGTVTVRSLFDMSIIRQAVIDSFGKLTPRRQVRNPVMFVVYVGSILTTLLWIQAIVGKGEAPASFIFWVSVWLWFTVLFANFAEAMAEGRGKAQAASLRKARRDLEAKRLRQSSRHAAFDVVSAAQLKKGDVVLVEANDYIPADGTIVEGVASVNEAAITGESAPVIREAGGDRSSVTGGTQVLSDWIIVEVTANPGEAFLDRMIALVEGAKRQKTPNEIALDILLAALTIVFLLATATLLPYSLYSVAAAGQGTPVTVTVLVALLVCLIPTTIGALLSAIGIAGMDRMIQKNVIAMSGRAVEAAGDVDVLLLDKTGTITLGNRQATQFVPAPGVTERELADAAQLASLADETPEGRSIVVLAKEKYGIRERDIEKLGATFVAFTAQTRMSGVNLNGRQVRKGAADAIEAYVKQMGGTVPADIRSAVDNIAKAGATPLVVADGAKVLGVIQLKDIVKGGIRERFAELRRMGIKTIMITGDNPLTAAAISAEAGRGRLPRPGHARGQAEADPGHPGAKAGWWR